MILNHKIPHSSAISLNEQNVHCALLTFVDRGFYPFIDMGISMFGLPTIDLDCCFCRIEKIYNIQLQ